MIAKIEKNYLNDALKHLDTNGNQIIDIKEWFDFFNNNKDDVWESAKTLVSDIIKDIFPHENPERFPILAEVILTNHSDDIQGSDNKKQVNLIKLYNYIIRFIAPQKYRAYQQLLDDKEAFFLYDGIIDRTKLEIFTNDDNRIMTADIYYLIVSYHIEPNIALEIVEHLVKNPSTEYNPDNFTLDADGVFYALAIQKFDNILIDADAILHYSDFCNISNSMNHVPHLFGIHNDLAQKISQTGQINYDIAYNFLNFYNTHYLELGIQLLCDALSVDLENNRDILNIIDFLGYTGKPDKIFREIAGTNEIFTAVHLKAFLSDNNIKFAL